MRSISILFILLLLIGCSKKKQVSDWSLYKSSADNAIEQLHLLKNCNIDKQESREQFLALISSAEAEIRQFLQSTRQYSDRQSRVAIATALEDFLVVRRLLGIKQADATDRLLQSADPEFFRLLKERYALGPALVLANQEYYFIDSVLHEVWQTASSNTYRAEKRLNEENIEQIKASKKKRALPQNGL